MTREIRVERRGARGTSAAEVLYVARDENGDRLLPAPTAAALDEKLMALPREGRELIDGAITELGEFVSQEVGEVEAVKGATEAERIATGQERLASIEERALAAASRLANDQARTELLAANPLTLAARDQSLLAAQQTSADRQAIGEVRGIVGYYIQTSAGLVLLEPDELGFVARAVLPGGRNHLAQVSVAPFDRADPARLIDGTAGAMQITGAGGFGATTRERVYLMDLTGTPYANALEIEIDDVGLIRSVVYNDGSAISTETTGGAPATLIESLLVPNGVLAQNPNGGFTCTGADQVPLSHPWSGCWLVGNHGKATSGSSAYTSSVVLISPDRRTVLKEWPMPAGVQSVQGVCRGFAPNTFYAVDKRPVTASNSNAPNESLIRLFDFNGVEDVSKRITVAEIMAAAGLAVRDFELNGLAFHPTAGTAGSLWIGQEGVSRVYLFDLATRTITRTLSAADIRPSGADQFGYDAASDLLYYSFGANGTNGSVRFLNAVTGKAVATLADLELCQAAEGCKIDHLGRLVVWIDGGYHTEAKPPLALSNTYTFSLGA